MKLIISIWQQVCTSLEFCPALHNQTENTPIRHRLAGTRSEQVKTSRYTRLQTSTPRHTGMAREWNIASSHNVYSSTISHHTQTSDSRSRSSRHTHRHLALVPLITHRRLALVPLTTHRHLTLITHRHFAPVTHTDISLSFLSSHTQTSRSRSSHHTQTSRSRSSHHTHRHLALIPLITHRHLALVPLTTHTDISLLFTSIIIHIKCAETAAVCI